MATGQYFNPPKNVLQLSLDPWQLVIMQVYNQSLWKILKNIKESAILTPVLAILLKNVTGVSYGVPSHMVNSNAY